MTGARSCWTTPLPRAAHSRIAVKLQVRPDSDSESSDRHGGREGVISDPDIIRVGKKRFPIMEHVDDHRHVFKTTFRSTNDQWLAGPIYLPTLPERGDPVRIREKANHSREQVGHVTNRTWLIVSKEPGESEVIVHVALD